MGKIVFINGFFVKFGNRKVEDFTARIYQGNDGSWQLGYIKGVSWVTSASILVESVKFSAGFLSFFARYTDFPLQEYVLKKKEGNVWEGFQCNTDSTQKDFVRCVVIVPSTQDFTVPPLNWDDKTFNNSNTCSACLAPSIDGGEEGFFPKS